MALVLAVVHWLTTLDDLLMGREAAGQGHSGTREIVMGTNAPALLRLAASCGAVGCFWGGCRSYRADPLVALLCTDVSPLVCVYDRLLPACCSL